jgi:DNA-binding NtrC family response regulator
MPNAYIPVIDLLLVDDETSSAVSLALQLKRIFGRKCNIIIAQSSRKALEMLRTIMVDAVVADQRMMAPGGCKMEEYLKTRHPQISMIAAAAFREGTFEKTFRGMQVKHMFDTHLDFGGYIRPMTADDRA